MVSLISTQSSIYEIVNYKIDSSRLVLGENEKVDESLLCGICQEVPFRPEECNSCQNIFCTDCISQWLEKKAKCPFDCPLPFQSNKPHKMIRQALGALKYRCLNRENGCEEIIMLESLSKHEGKCEFGKIKCPFSPDCSIEMFRKEKEKHEETCEYVVLKCEKCLFEVLRKDLKDHDCILYLKEKYLNLEKKFETYKEENDKVVEALSKKVACILISMQNVKKQDVILGNQKDKLCQNGHPLKWTMGDTINQCDLCKKNNIFSRYACSECGLRYCIFCVYPNLSDKKCPTGHEMIACANLMWHSCDMCRKSLDKEKKVFQDKSCDFDVCGDCMIKAMK